MFKKIAIGILSTLLVGAVGASAYNAVSTGNNVPEAAIAASTTQQASADSAVAQSRLQAQQVGENLPQAGQVGSEAAQWGAGLAPQGGIQQQLVQEGGQGQGQARRQGQQASAGSAATGTGVPAPQNGLQEWVVLEGTLSNYAAPNFTLLTDDGQAIAAELGNLNYLSSQGLTLNDGDRLQVVGFWDTTGALAIGQITQVDTGITVQLRDDLGRPAWRGGNR